MTQSVASFTPESIRLLRERLARMAPVAREKFVMKALRKGGRVIQRIASTPGTVVPVLAKPEYRRGKLYRKPGTLKEAISLRRSRDADRRGDLGVFINVRPARGGLRGADSPVDPFYWRFVHFGTKYMRARPFLTIAARELPGLALQQVITSLRADLQQLNLEGF